MHTLAFAETVHLFPDGTMFVHMGIILVMIWVLNRTLFKPIIAIIEAREKQKGLAGGEAGEIMRDVEKKQDRYAGELRDARDKGYAFVEAEQKKAAEDRAGKLAEAKTDVASVLQNGRAELEKETAAARATLAAQSDKLADNITELILRS